MGEDTGIQWTDHTFNPWWGCVKVSPGCRKCYAETLADRYGHDVWGAKKPRRFLSDAYWQGPVKWNAQAESGVPGVRGVGRHLVFCASMADVFEDYQGPDAERLVAERARLFRLIEATPHLDWQLLTKRPENMRRFAPVEWWDEWPGNVWAGTSAEDQRRLEERLPHLAEVPAIQRFLSIEPLLGPISLRPEIAFDYGGGGFAHAPAAHLVEWVIVGGESGPRHRPFDANWARSIRDECAEAGVPFFFKQHGGQTNKAGGRDLDGRTWDEFPR